MKASAVDGLNCGPAGWTPATNRDCGGRISCPARSTGCGWVTDFQTVTPGDPLAHAIEQILAGSQQNFPVLEDGHVVGILTRHDLLVGLTRHGQNRLVGDNMQREFETVDASEVLEMSFRRMQSCRCHTAPVLQRGKLVGLLTMETSVSSGPSRRQRKTSLLRIATNAD